MGDDRLEMIEFADAGDYNMPYAPAVKVLTGTSLYLAGVTAAPVYHSHPHVAGEFAGIPADPARQAEMTVDNREAVLNAAGEALAMWWR